MPPPEVVDMDEEGRADITKIRSYFEQLEREGVDYLYEAKLLVVGEAGAGKTTLTRKIQNPKAPLPAENESTKGIDIAQWTFRDGERNFRVNIWDFGGQEVYHATHQFFLTKRSLYMLVADNRKEDTDFFYWLNVIELLSNSSPVLILNNKKGGRERKIDVRSLQGRFDNLEEILASNLETDDTLSEIYAAIKYQLGRLSHIGTPLPKSWVRVRRALEEKADNYISYREFLEICEANGLTNSYFKENLSEFLHDLGICLHFKEDILLKKWVILKPTWGTDAVYQVLDNEWVMANNGRFDHSDLAHIWQEAKYADMQAELLRLMINFQLCYEIDVPGKRDVYIAPQLLPVEKPFYSWDEGQNLILRYSYRFMPKGIMTRFIVAVHQYIEAGVVWRSGVILAKEGARAEVIEHYTQSPMITVQVVGHNKRDLLVIIMDALDSIHASFERLQVDKLVPCNCESCRGSQKPYLYPFNELRDFISNGQVEIQCRRKPYKMVNILGLIDDIMSFKQFLARDKELEALLKDKSPANYQFFI